MAFGLEVLVRDTTDPSPHNERIYRFRSTPVRIGRNELNDLHLDKPYVSQFHAVLELSGEEIILRDLGSTNGCIVQRQRLSSNAVSLGTDGGGFAILNLVISLKKVSASQVLPSKPMKKAMNVTGMIQGPPAGLLEALIKAEKNPHAPAEIQNIRERYDAYRKSWSELRTSIQDATMARSGEERGSFVTWLSSEFGSLSHEPDFHHLAASAGAKALAMRDTAQEQAIALEGLRELSGEYAPDAPTPETADDIVQFLTRVRAVLDAFFKAYLPLRDGQRELEKELGIRSSVTSTDAIEIADSPQALAAALLGPWDEGEQPIELVESTLADVMIHHIAMLNGVMNGAKHILAEISPDAVRAAAANLQKRGVLSRGFGGGYKVLWQAFERCHADLAEEEKQLFALLFGRQFHQAFAQQQEILRSRG